MVVVVAVALVVVAVVVMRARASSGRAMWRAFWQTSLLAVEEGACKVYKVELKRFNFNFNFLKRINGFFIISHVI